MSTPPPTTLGPELPHRIAVLCYLFDAEGRVLLLHRRKPPNRDLYSPIGGKLEGHLGESPTACAQREIKEEAGLDIPMDQLHLTGIVTETAFQGETHWMMYLYEVTAPVDLPHGQEAPGEGVMEWHSRESINTLPIPETDANVIWPLFWENRGKFFTAHIDCRATPMTWQLEGGHGKQP